MKTHGSRVTRGHGMRKGISLMEMLIAIILLGVISSIGYSYYKNYYDTSMAAKQTKIGVLIDQANQLKNALELYRIKFGLDVTTAQALAELVNHRIITEVPATMPDVSAAGWVLETDVQTVSGGGTGANDQLVTYALNGTAASIPERLDYCNAINNIASGGILDFTVTNAAISAYADINAAQAAAGNSYFCWDSDGTEDAAGMEFVFITKYY